METDGLKKITEEVLRLDDEGKDVDEIAEILKIERYLVESVLISERRVYFR
jgi:hypothetical protein